MNGIHDLGGMHGFGPVIREESEPVFHAAWEGRVYAMLRRLNHRFPPAKPGAGRDIIERMGPARYLTSSYYERFLELLEKRALAEGVITEDELDARTKSFSSNASVAVPCRLDPNEAQAEVESLRFQS